MYIVSLKLIDW